MDASMNYEGPSLPGHLGMDFVSAKPGQVVMRMPIQDFLLAPNGFLHAGSVVSLADSAAGFGCAENLPEGAYSFTTIELKTNFLGTCRDGAVLCEANLLHGGRTTQVWDSEVRCEDSGKVIAQFRCTQLLLYK